MNKVKHSEAKQSGHGLFVTTVSSNIRLSSRYFFMTVDRPRDFPDPEPGSFIHMGVPARGRFFLRRPFSIFDCDQTRLSLLLAEKGEGTWLIRRLQPGDRVDFIGPVGTGFPESPGRRILAVTGGVGLAPLYFYRNRFQGTPSWPDGPGANRLIYGGRTKEDLFLDSMDLDAPDILLATDDGSHGFQGNAADLARAELKRAPADALYSCGPTPMLKAVAALAEEHGIPHWVSLENRMGCAVGACRGCVVPVHSHQPPSGGADADTTYKTVCRNGPVFPADAVDWERLPVP